MNLYRRIGSDRVDIDGLSVEVSTVFLPFNHQFIPGLPPLIFETMLFVDAPDHEFDMWLDRYSTQEQAEAGHAAIVEGLRASTTFSTGHKNACRCMAFVAEHVRPVDSCDNCFATLTAEVEADAKLCAECLADELALDFAQEQAEERSRERARGDR
ncbi:hypothetical protein [Antrihabitans spumae]|uniref:Uncharacterized protein n=1 Tax=Antrihabitans spumae TaxID=3373370 RepID=A0ABW7KID8_9NOCA